MAGAFVPDETPLARIILGIDPGLASLGFGIVSFGSGQSFMLIMAV